MASELDERKKRILKVVTDDTLPRLNRLVPGQSPEDMILAFHRLQSGMKWQI